MKARGSKCISTASAWPAWIWLKISSFSASSGQHLKMVEGSNLFAAGLPASPAQIQCFYSRADMDIDQHDLHALVWTVAAAARGCTQQDTSCKSTDGLNSVNLSPLNIARLAVDIGSSIASITSSRRGENTAHYPLCCTELRFASAAAVMVVFAVSKPGARSSSPLAVFAGCRSR